MLGLLDAMTDPNLFGRHFTDPSWSAWKAFIAALSGDPLSPDQLAVYQARTGRSVAPTKPFKEAALICGRRAGKSRILAFIASTLALRDYRPFLAAGEVATIAILASDRKQARAIFRFISGFLKNSRLIEALIEDENTEAIKLTNRVHIEISTASFRGTRGYTFAAVLCDEIATWRSDESMNPDTEILRACRPGMLTIPGSMLLMGSSPYSKSGELYRIYKRYFGRNEGRVLVWQGDTLAMNSKADREEIAEAYENDPQAAMAEFGAQFRDDLIGFISLETLEDITVHGRHSLPRLPGVEYAAMVDPSGGVNDSMALAIGHRDGHVAILDRLLEIRPPFNPDDAVRECADLCRAYGITRVVSDKYAAAWPVARFAEAGIALEQSAKPKSDLYLNFLSLANSGRVELLDNGRMLSQFAGLQRRTARSGRDSVDHARDTHDDVCNVAAGVLVGLDLDRRPALVRQSDMLVHSAALPLPGICKYVFAALAVDDGGMCAVVYAAKMWTDPSLLLLDFDVRPLSGSLLADIGSRAAALALQCRARGHVMMVPASMLVHAQAIGLPAEAIPDDIKPEELLLSAANHAVSGAVKICAPAMDKARTAPFSGALDFRAAEGADDPLRAAALLTIALALDQTQ